MIKIKNIKVSGLDIATRSMRISTNTLNRWIVVITYLMILTSETMI